MKRYPLYSSKSARISRRVGAVAVFVSIVAVIAHRFGMIDLPAMVYSVLASAILGVATIGLALFAFARLWAKGGSGGASALLGLFLGILTLAPLALYVSKSALSPGLGDVSTDWIDPPQFVVETSSDLDVPVTLTAILEVPGADGQEERYPDIVPRRYRIPPGQLHAAVMIVVERNDWPIIFELPPDLLDAPTGLQVEARTRILGMKEDMVVRIRPDPVGALLDVRSTSRTGFRGLTDNVVRVRGFFAEIDDVLRETYGRLEQVAVDEEEALDPEQAGETEGSAAGNAEEQERIPVPAFKPFFEEAETILPEETAPDDLAG